MRKEYKYSFTDGAGVFESWFKENGTVVLPLGARVWKSEHDNTVKYLNRKGEVFPEECPYVLTYTTTDGNPIDREWGGDFIHLFNDFGTILFAGLPNYILIPEQPTLQSITIPNGIPYLGAGAFANCFNLQSAVIPNSVVEISPPAFYGCTSLADITYLGRIEECENAFSYGVDPAVPATYVLCDDGRMSLLCELKYTTTDDLPITPYNMGYKTSTFENGIGVIGLSSSQPYLPSGAFESCTSLKTIELSNRITEIGSQAFVYCSSLESVVLGDRTQTILNEAFYECTSLKSITIPESVYNIGLAAFYKCSALEEITCLVEQPLSISDMTFDGVNKTIPLYVPAMSLDSYESAYTWNEFTNMIPILGPSEYTLTATPSNEAYGTVEIVYHGEYYSKIAARHSEMYEAKSCIVNGEEFPMETTYRFTVTEDTEIIVNFDIKLCTVSLSSTEGGTTTGDGVYNAGTAVTIEAIPSEGYEFYMWSDGNTELTRTFEIFDDLDIIAVFNDTSGKVIYYTTTDGLMMDPYDTTLFGANLIDNVYE